MKRLVLVGLLHAAALLHDPRTAVAAAALEPSELAFREHPGVSLPLDATFQESDGRLVRVGELSGGRPMILVLGYFRCPNLCGVVRASLFRALAGAGLAAGEAYSLAVVGIDPAESCADAKEAKERDVAAFHLVAGRDSLHYLVGRAAQIRRVGDSVGFSDRVDTPGNQIIHPAGVIFVTAEGRISSYALGVGYTPRAVRGGIERAAAGRIEFAAPSPILLLCFHFDPSTGRYSLEIVKLLRLAALLMVIVLGGTLWLLFRRERPAS